MGLFGTSPQKKLEKARTAFQQRKWYEAWQLLEGVVDSPKLSDSERSEARVTSRSCRERMILERIEEADALRQAGDLAGARDRCATALDLAGDDLDRGPAEELLRRIDAPARKVAPGGLEAAAEPDLLPDPEATARPRPTLLDRMRSAPEAAPMADEEFFGDDPDHLFGIHMDTLTPATAGRLRSYGRDFQFGYLATVGGDGRRALRYFDRVDWAGVDHPAALRARANAYLLAERPEECLDVLDAIPPLSLELPGAAERGDADGAREPGASRPEETAAGPADEAGTPADEPSPEQLEALAGEGERRYLRIEALRALERYDEAVEAAQALVGRARGASPAAESLLGWTLIEAGRAEEARERLTALLTEIGYHEEILVPAAQAAVALGDDDEARRLLEELIQLRMERSLVHGRELDFPVEAGRRLLELYARTSVEAEKLQPLLMHLIDHDPANAEAYRDELMRLGAR